MPVSENPHPPRLRRSSISRARERGGVRARPFRKYAKRAGLIVLALVALDIAAAAAAVVLGVEFLKR